jgi:hypothetical protein
MNMDSPTTTGAGGYISILLALDNVFNFAGRLVCSLVHCMMFFNSTYIYM